MMFVDSGRSCGNEVQFSACIMVQRYWKWHLCTEVRGAMKQLRQQRMALSSNATGRKRKNTEGAISKCDGGACVAFDVALQ